MIRAQGSFFGGFASLARLGRGEAGLEKPNFFQDLADIGECGRFSKGNTVYPMFGLAFGCKICQGTRNCIATRGDTFTIVFEVIEGALKVKLNNLNPRIL